VGGRACTRIALSHQCLNCSTLPFNWKNLNCDFKY
jgi:hypothetical protein